MTNCNFAHTAGRVTPEKEPEHFDGRPRSRSPAYSLSREDRPAELHDVRKAFVSMLINWLTSKGFMQFWLGHSDAGVTRRRRYIGFMDTKAKKKLPSVENAILQLGAFSNDGRNVGGKKKKHA